MLYCLFVFLLLCAASSRSMVVNEDRADGLDDDVNQLKAQVDDLTRQLNDAISAKARLTQENFDLQHQVQELDSANAEALSQLQAQNEDLKRKLDDEIRQRENLLIQLSQLQDRYDKESNSASTLRTQLRKANAEFAALHTRFEKQLMVKNEELEELRSALRATNQLNEECETQRAIDNNQEKTNARLVAEIKEITIELENTQIIVQDLTQRNRALETDKAALKRRVDELGAENQALRTEKAILET